MMDQRSGQKRAVEFLYPPIDPFDQRIIDMGDGHRVYVEQCGNPKGIPVVVLHGGPGGGCSPAMRRYFDPAVFRVILFDQRGCGRSRPHAVVIQNTTWHLVADIEVIRKELAIDRWICFGGSWGATLALIYAITHPERVTHMVLRGVFLMTRAELDWFYGGGAGAFFPELWARFVNAIPSDERGNLIAAYHRRLFSGNVMEETRFGRIWANWENALASIHHNSGFGVHTRSYRSSRKRAAGSAFSFLEPSCPILSPKPPSTAAWPTLSAGDRRAGVRTGPHSPDGRQDARPADHGRPPDGGIGVDECGDISTAVSPCWMSKTRSRTTISSRSPLPASTGR
jgi:proline iminopeptidase